MNNKMKFCYFYKIKYIDKNLIKLLNFLLIIKVLTVKNKYKLKSIEKIANYKYFNKKRHIKPKNKNYNFSKNKNRR